MVAKTKATLKVVRTRIQYVLIYSKIENALFWSILWTQVANCTLKGTMFGSYVPATVYSTAYYHVHT